MGWLEDKAGGRWGGSSAIGMGWALRDPGAGERGVDNNFPCSVHIVTSCGSKALSKYQPQELFQRVAFFKHWPCTWYLSRRGTSESKGQGLPAQALG